MDISIWAVFAQIINFWILFFIFKKFLTKPITKTIMERRELIKKLKDADKAYDEKLEIAKIEAREIVQEGMERKEKLLTEAGLLADKKKEDIISDAKVQSDKILSNAESKAKSLESELEQSFVAGIKRTSLLVIKKLIKKDNSLKQEYLDEAIKEAID